MPTGDTMCSVRKVVIMGALLKTMRSAEALGG